MKVFSSLRVIHGALVAMVAGIAGESGISRWIGVQRGAGRCLWHVCTAINARRISQQLEAVRRPLYRLQSGPGAERKVCYWEGLRTIGLERGKA